MSPCLPTPTQRNYTARELAYRGPAMAQLNILREQMRLGGLTIGSRRVKLDDGAEVFCNICFNAESVQVVLPVTKVGDQRKNYPVETGKLIIHPRIGIVEKATTLFVTNEYGQVSIVFLFGVSGGWDSGKTLLQDRYAFPLIDEDNGSFTLTSVDSGSFSGESGNYGNINWSDGSNTISWHGTPARHVVLKSDNSIPGLTKVEYSNETSLPPVVINTPFDSKIYQMGRIVALAPRYTWVDSSYATSSFDRCLVLGAMRNKTTGKIYAVCQSYRGNPPNFVAVMSDSYVIFADEQKVISDYALSNKVTVRQQYTPAPGGVYTCLFVFDGLGVDGWTLLSEMSTGSNKMCWFGNESGTSFVRPDGATFTIDGVYTSKNQLPVVMRTTVPVVGSINNGALASINISDHHDNYYYEYVQDIVASAHIITNFSAVSTRNDTETTYKTYPVNTMLLAPGTEPPPLTQIVGPDHIPGPGDYSYGTVGGEGSITLSATFGQTVPGYIGVIRVTDVNLCGAGYVTATDSCGESISMAVRMPSGYMVLESEEYYTQASNGDVGKSKWEGDLFITEQLRPMCGGGYSDHVTVKQCAYPNTCLESDIPTHSYLPAWVHDAGSPRTVDWSAPVAEPSIWTYYNCSVVGQECMYNEGTASIEQTRDCAWGVVSRLIQRYVCA